MSTTRKPITLRRSQVNEDLQRPLLDPGNPTGELPQSSMAPSNKILDSQPLESSQSEFKEPPQPAVTADYVLNDNQST